MRRIGEAIEVTARVNVEFSVAASDARRHLPQLLSRVESGERSVIALQGKAVAHLVPAIESKAKTDVKDVLEELRRFQQEQGPTLGPDVSIRGSIEAGRRF